MNKKYLLGISILLIPVLIWYFVFKESDYNFRFRVKASTGTVFQGINEWASNQSRIEGEKVLLLEKSNFNKIHLQLDSKEAQVIYSWEITVENDSVSYVDVGVKEPHHSLYNRCTMPFINTQFRNEQTEKIKSFKKELDAFLKNFKVKIEGEGKSEEVFVAYISLKSVLQEKAQTMIKNDPIITGFLYNNKIKITGRPYVEIEKWDFDKEQLEFNYCFPVDKNTKTIEDAAVKFKTIPAQKGLKATYNGNFRTSDRAWFALLDYAATHHYKLKNTPLEHFLANPFDGGDELGWETKIIIPFE